MRTHRVIFRLLEVHPSFSLYLVVLDTATLGSFRVSCPLITHTH